MTLKWEMQLVNFVRTGFAGDSSEMNIYAINVWNEEMLKRNMKTSQGGKMEDKEGIKHRKS